MRQLTWILTVIGVCLCVSANTFAHTPAKEEALLKVGFIYNFSKLTRWPQDTWREVDAPLILCTVGDDTLAHALEGLVGKTVKGHSVVVRPLQRLPDPLGCHVLYVAVSEQQRVAELVTGLVGKPILSISEIDGFALVGGIIELVRVHDQIRFKINLDAARENGLELSSRLLSLALVISREILP